jgi:hypothetical protein
MNKQFIITMSKVAGVVLSLYLFLVGINGLSTAIKHLGGGFAESMLSTTSNPFIALFIGILSTTIFQSSSTTTSLIVGMVSSGALNLGGAVPMIMGANIGTTVTNIIVSIGHINRGNEFKRAFAAATVHDFFNVFAVLIWPMETIILVTVVPMFAPIIMGTAPPKFNAPLLTIPTINEVVVEELWKIVVERIPINKAINGLLVVESMLSANPPPKCLIAVDNPFIPTRNRYNESTTPATLLIVIINCLFILKINL